MVASEKTFGEAWPTKRSNSRTDKQDQMKSKMDVQYLAYNRYRRSPLTTLLTLALLVLLLLWLRCHLRSAGYPFFAPSSAAGAENLTLVVLPAEVAATSGAYCLDGSPPSYYIHKAKSGGHRASWLVALQGGGWCWNVSDCYQRSLTELGSSSLLPKGRSFQGVMSRNATVNPEFYDWNMIMINYCDGASFSGNLASPVKFQGSTIYFRGARILRLVFEYLLKSEGLERAKRVILSGISAGGLAVFLHGDTIRDFIPAVVPVHCLADAGFFLNEKNISGYYHYGRHMREILTMQNAQGSLNHNCLKTLGEADGWKCFFAPYTYPFMTTPLFLVNSAADYWQQWFVLDLRCHPRRCPDKLPFLQGQHARLVREATVGAVAPRHRDSDGLFITSCFAHGQAFLDQAWAGYSVGGKTARQAFGDWYFGRTPPKESRYVDCDTNYDCNPSCAKSWTLAYYKNRTERMMDGTPDF